MWADQTSRLNLLALERTTRQTAADKIIIRVNMTNSDERSAADAGPSSGSTALPAVTIAASNITTKNFTSVGETVQGFRFLIENPSACNIFNDPTNKVDTVAYILATAKHFDHRAYLRHSWAGSQYRNITRLLPFFFIAVPAPSSSVSKQKADAELMQQVRAEASKYNDIVLVDYVDSYRNLTYKTLSGIRWILQRCLKQVPERSHWPRFVLKADDDMIVDMVLQRLLVDKEASQAGENATRRSFFCDLRSKVKPEFGNKRSKWYITRDEWPQDVFPNYCLGASYTHTTDLLEPLLEAANNHPYLYLEDAFMSGILRRDINASIHSWTKHRVADAWCAKVNENDPKTKALEGEWRSDLAACHQRNNSDVTDEDMQIWLASLPKNAATSYASSMQCYDNKKPLVWMHLQRREFMVQALWWRRILPLYRTTLTDGATSETLGARNILTGTNKTCPFV